MITCNTVVDHNKRIPRSRLRWIAITKFVHSVYMTCQVPSQDIFSMILVLCNSPMCKFITARVGESPHISHPAPPRLSPS